MTIIRKYYEIIETNIKFSPYSLILLDIDNTILRAATYHGSVEAFENLFQEKLKEGYSYNEALTLSDSQWTRLQHEIETILIDEEIHSFIEIAKNYGATIIAFTARSDFAAEVTYNQITSHNIALDKLEGFRFEKQYIFKDPHNDLVFKYSSIFHQGILFGSGFDENSKGRVFIDFYPVLAEYREDHQLPEFKEIIFVDDKKYNLISMEEATKKLGLDYYSYHIHI